MMNGKKKYQIRKIYLFERIVTLVFKKIQLAF